MASAFTKRVGLHSMMRPAAALLLAGGLLAVLGCGGGGVTGTYVAEKGTPGESMKFALELKGGGVAVLTMSGGPDGASFPPVTGTYSVDGDKITTVLDNDRDELVLKDGTLSMDFFGEQLTLKKQ